MKLEANRADNLPASSLNDNLFVFDVVEKTTFCRQMVSIFVKCSEEIFMKLVRICWNCVLQGRIWPLPG